MSLEGQVHIAEWSSSVARRAHNPEVAGSNPVSATRSVTVADTISATVIFYFPPSEERFLRKRDFSRTFPAIGAMCARICCGHDGKIRDLANWQSL